MKIHISINCDNAAFGDSAYECGEELRRILYHLGDELATNGPIEAAMAIAWAMW